MKNALKFCVLLAFLWSCGNNENDKTLVLGSWKADWKTEPESFPDIEDVDLTMDGQVVFTTDSVSITAYGYPGCIFSSDTLTHSLTWKMSNDSLHLINDEEIYGISYKILTMSSAKVELQLMDDIYLTLSKP